MPEADGLVEDAGRESITGAELVTNPLVFFPRAAGSRAHDRNLAPLLESGRRPRIVQEATNWTILLYLVAAGLGVTIAPRSATFTAPESVRIIPLAGIDAATTIYTAHRADDNRPLVRNPLDLLPNQPRGR
ncbi:LysR family substrate-binding domain-containing protein [Nocardia sp. NBC_01503]|uniref:LysR family substrate-binding domain-containing protein n=1 Tax=Nocardia sp. NBC_01503 TaxID=2975997 RepID=UPI002E7C0801|nr:LysR family substrate-binding domain-containing protein [Nocardia sp. NBC_01503]